MAGGMTPGHGPPIGQRPVIPSPGSAGHRARRGTTARQPHVWVDTGTEPAAGLVIEQVRLDDGTWRVLVVYLLPIQDGTGVVTIQGWLPAERLRLALPAAPHA